MDPHEVIRAYKARQRIDRIFTVVTIVAVVFAVPPFCDLVLSFFR